MLIVTFSTVKLLI